MAIRGRRVLVLAAAGLAVAGALAVVVLLVGSHGRTAAGGTEESVATLGSAQVVRLERGLAAPGIAGQATVVAGEIRAQFIARGERLLPAGSRVYIRAATFDARSAQTATVDASVSGPDPGRWQLLLIKEAGNWLLIGTRRLT